MTDAEKMKLLTSVTNLSEAEKLVASWAATIAAGIAGGIEASPDPVNLPDDWGSAEDVAKRALSIVRAIVEAVES